MKHKHTLRTGISLLLVLCMVLSICPLTAFAKADAKLNLVSLGDSMTNGYGHDKYYEGTDPGTQVNGFRQNDVKTTYPYYLKERLKDTHTDRNVKWEALAVSCMRTEDVNFLLRYHTEDDAWNTLAQNLDDSSTYGDSTVENWNNGAKAAWESTFVDDGKVIGDYFTWNEFVQGRFWDWQKTLTENKGEWESNPTLAYAGVYQDAVKNADVITLGTGNANFGVIMLQNITSYLTGTFGSGFKDAVPVREVIERRFPAEIKDTAVEILDKVDELVEPNLTMLEGKAAKVLEIVEYTTVSFMFSYMDMLHAIDDLNDKDNLDVIMMGLMNTMDGVKIDLGDDQIFDLGAVVDGITDVLSAYYFVLPVALQELNGDFENITFYIVPNDDYIEMQVSDMADLGKIKTSNTIRERMIQEVSGMIFNLVKQPLNAALGSSGVQLPTWSMNDNNASQYREKVEAYEQLQADYKAWVDGGYKGLFNIADTNDDGALKYGALFTGETPTFNADDALACAVYLAFERAVANAAAGNATLDLDGLMSLMGGTEGLADMITLIADALNLDPSALTGKVTLAVGANLGMYVVSPKPGTTPAPESTPVEGAVTLLVKSDAANDDAARADGATYKTIQGALAKAQNGDTIKLVTDITTNDVVYISGTTGTTKLILDLNGKTLMSSYAVSGRVAVEAQSNVDVTIQNGTIISTGTEATVYVKGGTGNNSKLTLVDVTVGNNLAGAGFNVYVNGDSVPALVLKGATTLIGGSTLIRGNNTNVAVEADSYNFYPTTYVDKNKFEVTQNTPAHDQSQAPQEIQLFTLIELTNALNGALGTALVSEDAASLGGLLSLYARMIIGNGIGSHPTADGHKTLFNEIMEVYPDKPAKEQLIEMAKEYGEELYDLALEYGAEALTKVVNYVAEKEYITDEQAAALKELIAAADKAIKTGDTDDLLAICEEIAHDLYTYAVANGYVPEEVQKAVNEFFRIYDELKGLTPEQQKAYVKGMLEELAEKYGPKALEKLNEYVLSLDVLDERQLGELEAKIWDFINAYPDAPDATVDAAIDELVDFLFEITELDKDKVMEMYEYLTTTSREQMLADAAELMQKYLDKYGPEALEYVETYLIAEGYLTKKEIAAITEQVKLAIAAYEAQDKAAMEASCEKLAELVYDYADEKGYIPAEVKEACAKAIELYEKYGEVTPEEIKAFAAAELEKFIAEHKEEALIALDTYLVNEGWMSTTEMKGLAEKIADAIAAYKADPEGTADAMIEELVGYIYNKAVAEGYIDPAKVEELNKLVDLIKEACDYFANTPEEQIKADAIDLLFDELDKLTDGKVNAEVYAHIKEDVAGLIEVLRGVKLDDIWTTVYTYIDSVKGYYLELVGELVDAATHGKYVPNGESYYVALGGKTVYGTGLAFRNENEKAYADLLLAELGKLGLSKENYKNLGNMEGLLTTGILAYIEENKDEIEKADLITYQADATAFILAALNKETPDWSRYLTAEQIAFVEQALPVIQTILEDDWTKYAGLDADKIVDDIKAEVLGAIDDAIMDAFNGQADKLDELLSICVAQVKSYVEYIQEQAFELYFEAEISEIVLCCSLMKPVYEVLGEDWASYADLDVDEIVGKIKGEVLAKAGEAKNFSAEKIDEVLTHCVEKARELHECANAEIAKLPEYFSDEELAFAQAAFGFVWEYAVKQWPELAELNVKELHDKAYAEIKKLLTEADNFNYEQYVDLGAGKIEEILNCCIDKAKDAIEDIQSKSVAAVSVIEKAEFVRFLKEALNFAFDYLAEDWTVYVDKSAAWVSNKIKNAVIAEMYQHSSFGKEYVDQYADELTAILTACIEEVQNVLQTAQNQKDEVLNVLNTIEHFKPYIEKLLFASVAYAVDTAKAVDAIQAINPDATLIVVGMYNPLDGLEIVMNGKTIDVGAYMDYLIDATNVYYTALAVADGEFTFVAVPDTEINGFEKAIDVDALDVADLGMTLLGLNNSMYADAAGHENIFTRIMDALDTTNELVSISVTTAPIKTSYVAGQNFDPTGMVIEATYYNGTTADVTGWKVTDGTALTAGKTSVTISYTEDGVTKTTTQKITVTSPNPGPSGGGGAASYTVSAATATHGKVTVDKTSASAGDIVTITVLPDKGFTLETLTVKDAKGNNIALTTVKAGETYTFKMPAGKVTVEVTFMEDNTMLNFFVDVPTTAYYYDAVLWAAKNGITLGVDDAHFAPMAIATRGQMVTFLWRAAGCPEPTATTCAFTDVKADAYYYKAVLWAVETGITKGTSDTTFSPDENVSRSQTVTFLARMSDVKDDATGYSHNFADVKTTDYYNNAVAWAATNKITVGTSATTFSPNDDCLRGQIVTFLYRNFVK